MLVGDVAMICEGIICKTCVELDIEIIEIAVNPDLCTVIPNSGHFIQEDQPEKLSELLVEFLFSRFKSIIAKHTNYAVSGTVICSAS